MVGEGIEDGGDFGRALLDELAEMVFPIAAGPEPSVPVGIATAAVAGVVDADGEQAAFGEADMTEQSTENP